jgi:arginase
MRVELIVVPYDSGHRGARMGAGPEHLVRAGLPARLAAAGHEVGVRMVESRSSWRSEVRTAFELAGLIADEVRDTRSSGAFPLVLSGNCLQAALGTVAALEAPAVFWFDAHGDFNTPETTIGGFLDGMALATVTGRCWTQLSSTIPGFQPVAESRVVLIGARDLDPFEAAALDRSSVRRLSVASLRTAPSDGAAAGYVHLDLDVLDPSGGAANSYAVPGGLTRGDVESALDSIASSTPVLGAALTAYDPAVDTLGSVAESALALGAALVAAAGRVHPASRRGSRGER